MNRKILIPFLATVLLLSTVTSVYGITNDEAKKKIINSVNSKVDPNLSPEAIDAIDKTVEGNWTTLDMVTVNYLPNSTTINTLNISQFGNNNTETIINGTEPLPPPNPCPPDMHLENGICVPNNPDPKPNVTIVEVLLAGDVDGKKVFTALGNEKADYLFVLGDCEYSNADACKPYMSLAKVTRLAVGNHDDFVLTGDTWQIKTGKVLWIGFNSEKSLTSQKTALKGFIDNAGDVKSIHLLSHKPTESVPPNSHHGIEDGVKAVGDYVESIVPDGVILYKENGHNHVYSESADGLLKQIGLGGREHYTCGQNTVWIYCNNDDFGYYKYVVNLETGETTGNLYNAQGQVIH